MFKTCEVLNIPIPRFVTFKYVKEKRYVVPVDTIFFLFFGGGEGVCIKLQYYLICASAVGQVSGVLNLSI